jgi:hypothetical protein
MARLLATVVVLSAASLAGCNTWRSFWGTSTSSSSGPPPVVLPAMPNEVPPHAVAAQPVAKVRLLKLTMPLGTFSLNEKVWRQLDEDSLDSQTSVLLAQNGLRAGVGPTSRWPAISKLVDLPGATTQQYICQTDGRSTINIITRASIMEQTVFYVDKDRQLEGRTFDRCDNSIRLSLNQVKDSTDLVVQVEPVVQIGTIDIVRGPQEMGVVRVTSPLEETFKNLRLGASLKAEQFLVIAPADPKGAGAAFSVGTRFLSDSDKVPPLETVLVFVPIVDEKK